MKALETFPLESVEDIRRFERCLDSYAKTKTRGFAVAHFSLAEAFISLQGDPEGGRMFAALVDIRLSLVLLACDAVALGGWANKVMPREPTDDQSFEVRMGMHAHGNSFILRFRSLWDKFMGLLILRFAPQEYDRFSSAKSKKAVFRKVMCHHAALPDGFVALAESIVQRFDDTHRTSEAHGTGSLRKTSFAWSNHNDSPPSLLLGYWNFANDVAHNIGGEFDPKARERRKMLAATTAQSEGT